MFKEEKVDFNKCFLITKFRKKLKEILTDDKLKTKKDK